VRGIKGHSLIMLMIISDLISELLEPLGFGVKPLFGLVSVVKDSTLNDQVSVVKDSTLVDQVSVVKDSTLAIWWERSFRFSTCIHC
jgi:hypothetical protein